MDNDFTIGDVVSLKSGGPKMTISGILSSESQSLRPLYMRMKVSYPDAECFLNCEWFDDKGAIQQRYFMAQMLKKVGE